MAMQSAWLLAHCLITHQMNLASESDEIGIEYCAKWKACFAARLHAAAVFAHLAMRPKLSSIGLPILRHFPTILTFGAHLSGKANSLTRCTRSTMRSSTDEAKSVPLSTWVGFSMMCVGMFMAILDVQVVATSLPTIQQALNIAQDQMSWIQTAYLIAEVIAIPLTGFFTRMLTMRWLFVTAISIFTIASIACAASNSFETLIASRVVQGFFGGALIPAVFAAVFLLFPLRLQGIATTIAGVLAVLAPTVGPVVGGWITETFSWHWLFLINVVPGIASAILSVVFAAQGAAFSWPSARFRLVFLGIDGAGPCSHRDRHQGSATTRLEITSGRWPAGHQRSFRRGMGSPNAQSGEALCRS